MRHIWRWVPRLELDSSDFTDDRVCVDFIDKFLAFQGNSYLREFKLTIYNDAPKRGRVFSHATCLGKVLDVRKLERFQVENKFGLGGFVYIGLITLSVCEALVCLKLHYVRLNEFVSLSLPSLKIMYLEDVIMSSDAAAEALISSSPVLEVLNICLRRREFFAAALRVCSLSLKNLTLQGLIPDYHGCRRSVVIDTPKLEYLSLVDRYKLKSFEIISVADSVKVDLDFEFVLITDYYSERKNLHNLLHNFSCVGDVTMSWRTLQFIHRLYLETDPLPKIYGLTRLRASMCLNASHQLLPIILEICPYLKYLTLDLFLDYQRQSLSEFSTVLPRCLVSSLESVELESPFTEVATELDLARYFLENSTTLKKLVLRLNQSFTGEKHKPGVLEQLIDSPRRSSMCKFEVIPLVPHPNAWPDGWGCLCNIE